MKKTLSTVLEIAAVTGLVGLPACDNDDDNNDETAMSSGSEAGCPGAEAGCPGADTTGGEAGCPGAEAGCPGAEDTMGAEAGCPGAEAGCPGAEAGCPGAEGGCPSAPAEAAEVIALLEDGGYDSWSAEPAVHEARGSSPHGNVRVFINEALEGSLEAGNDTHPVGAAAIKELYDEAGEELVGFAVEVKVTEGSTGDDWYWYMEAGGEVMAEGTGVELCVGCHMNGVDFFTTTYPLE